MLPDEERSRLRKTALTWLRDDLTALTNRLDADTMANRTFVGRVLRTWQIDTALASIRDTEIGKLPEAERAEWRKLWDDVVVLQRRAGARP